jgi:hypothetical protein
MDRLHDAGRLAEDRGAELRAAMADAERAIKHGDEEARGLAEARIDKLFEGARAARPADQEPAQQAISFDGGVRTAVPVRRGTNMNRLLAQAAGRL